MILDSIGNLNAVYDKLSRFLASSKASIRIEAVTQENPESYAEFLPYLELIKSQGKVSVQFGEGKGILISGSSENLTTYIEAFKFGENEDGNHHHPEFSLINKNNFYMGNLWPFIEADNDYVTEHDFAN